MNEKTLIAMCALLAYSLAALARLGGFRLWANRFLWLALGFSASYKIIWLVRSLL